MLQIGFFRKKAFHIKQNAKLTPFMRFYQVIQFFFHLYCIGTKELVYLDQTTALYWKSYLSTENLTFGIQNLSQTSRDQTVPHHLYTTYVDSFQTFSTFPFKTILVYKVYT